MADTVYASADGFVQFDPRTREVNNQTVRDVTIKSTGAQKLIGITLWPEWDDVEINKGDFVAVDGSYTVRTVQGDDGGTKEYHNISAGSLAVLPGLKKRESEVVRPAANKSKPSF